MKLRDIVFGRRSMFPRLTEATGFDILAFPGDLDKSMFAKMSLHKTVDIRRIDEEITHVFDQPGGIVVFSVDVNVYDSGDNIAAKIRAFIANKWQTIVNRLVRYRKIDRAADQADPTNAEIRGMSIGRFFRGRYRSNSGLTFDETSLSVEVIGIGDEMLLAFATALAKEFRQESVLVKDYASNRIYLADKHPSSILDLMKIRNPMPAE